LQPRTVRLRLRPRCRYTLRRGSGGAGRRPRSRRGEVQRGPRRADGRHGRASEHRRGSPTRRGLHPRLPRQRTTDHGGPAHRRVRLRDQGGAPPQLMTISVLAAFLGGALALLSPCSALLLPAFFASSSGVGARLAAHILVFFAGLLLVLVRSGSARARSAHSSPPTV